ncbi:MAG: hypothetical protein JST11_31785, partial [Acidobacteria bacterium]|nr:hypothetical protein [Acidobacteriota bacterium]
MALEWHDPITHSSAPLTAAAAVHAGVAIYASRRARALFPTIVPLPELDDWPGFFCAALLTDSGGLTTAVASIYAPERVERARYFDALSSHLQGVATRHTVDRWIIGGDWNVVLDAQDRTSSLRHGENGAAGLHAIVDALGLRDVFRTLHPDEREYTHSHTNSNSQLRQSRLDRIYATHVGAASI